MRMQSCVRLCLGLLLIFSLPLFAQDQQDSLSGTILGEDGAFWDAYNRCDVQKMSEFFWADIEFYHDKGGPTIGLGRLAETFQKNGVTYGAVLSGEHYFYINDNGKPEYLDGVAKFFHLWLVKDGTWKMARVVSYDHHAPPYENKRKELTVSPNVLEQYTGVYVASKTGRLKVTRDNTLLILTAGNQKYVLHPESDGVFFTVERDLTFEFVKEGAKFTKVVVREHGAIVEEAK